MTTSEQDFAQYTDKRVNLTKVGEGQEPVEGKVEMGNALAVLFKPKGKSQPELVEASDIASIELLAEKAKAFTAKKLKAVELGGVRAHLLERHGVTLDWANSVTEEQAKQYHDSLDHADLWLGHVHRTADEDENSKRESAIEQAQQDGESE